VFYFAATSLFDGFDDSPWNKGTLDFISAFFAFIA